MSQWLETNERIPLTPDIDQTELSHHQNHHSEATDIVHTERSSLNQFGSTNTGL